MYRSNGNRPKSVQGLSPDGQMSVSGGNGSEMWNSPGASYSRSYTQSHNSCQSTRHVQWENPYNNINMQHGHNEGGRMPSQHSYSEATGQQTQHDRWRGPPPSHFSGPPPSFRGKCSSYNSYWNPAGMRGPPPRSPQAPQYPSNNSPQFPHQGRGRGRFPNHRGQMRGGYSSPGVKRDRSQSSQGSAKKQKMSACADSRPYYCKACDKGYNDKDFYDQHVATHILCSIDGCPYVAARRLVELHREMQHHSGLAKKIWQLESKEDIENWRLERKKKFPTKENIDKKKAMLQEKIDRGEVLETKSFGKFGRGGRGRGRGRRGGRGRYQQDRSEQQHEDNGTVLNGRVDCTSKQSAPQKELINSTSDASAASKPDHNPINRNHSDHINPEADPLSYVLDLPQGTDDKKSGKDPRTDMNPTIGGALCNLMCAYSDSSEEEGQIKMDEEDDDRVNTLQTSKKVHIEASPAPLGDQQSHSSPITPEKSRTQNTPSRENKKKPHSYKDSAPKRSMSLLEKLLASEIRHERNMILQCVRHIVTNDFFGARANNNVKDFPGRADDLNHIPACSGAEI